MEDHYGKLSDLYTSLIIYKIKGPEVRIEFFKRYSPMSSYYYLTKNQNTFLRFIVE